MPNWKKVITSGSDAHLNHITASGNISSSGTIIGNAFKTNNTNQNGLFEDAGEKLTISASNDLIINTADDIFFQSEGTEIVHIRGDEAELEVNGGLNVESHITASGNISSSGTGTNFFNGNFKFDGDTTISTVGGSDDISINPEAQLNLGTGASDEINIGRQSGTCDINMYANTSTVAARFLSSTITFNHPITASANISASNQIISKHLILPTTDGSSITGGGLSFGTPGNDHGHIYDDGTILTLGYNDFDAIKIHDTGTILEVEGSTIIDGNLKTTSHITASGNISSSGTVTANALSVTTFNPTNLSTGNITASGDISSSGKLTIGDNLTILATGASSGEKIFVIKEDGGERFSVNEDGEATLTAETSPSDQGGLTITQNGGMTNAGLTIDTNGTSVEQTYLVIKEENNEIVEFKGEGDGNDHWLDMKGGIIQGVNQIYVNQDVVHTGDPDTKISFATDKITLAAGGVDMITLTEAGSDTIQFGAPVTSNLDFGVDDTGVDVKFFAATSGQYMKWLGATGGDLLKFTDNTKIAFGNAQFAEANRDAEIFFDDTDFQIKTYAGGTTGGSEIILNNVHSGKGVTISGSGNTHLNVKGEITASGNISASNANFIGKDIELYGGQIVLKNSGSRSNIKFYCEDANQHFQTLMAAPHSDGASNTLVLPAAGSNLVSDTATQTLTNKTLTSPTINNITTFTANGDLDIGAHDFRAATLTADGLTSGRVVFAGTNGVLSDDGDFTFSTDTLTVTKIANVNSTSHITASVNISASNNVICNEIIVGGGTFTSSSLAAGGSGGGGGISFDGSVANGVLTFKDSDEATTEANLTFDGTDLTIDGGLTLKGTGSLQFNHFNTGSNPVGQTYDAATQAQGDIVKFGAGSTSGGKLYYLDTDGNWELANATDNSKGANELLAISLGSDPISDGMLLRGLVRFGSLSTTGTAVFMGTSNGAISQTAPNSNDNIVRVMGYLLDNTKKQIWFNPSSVWVKVTA